MPGLGGHSKVLDSIIVNYIVILETFKQSLQDETKTEMKSRINGVMYQMKTNSTFSMVYLVTCVEVPLLMDNFLKIPYSRKQKHVSISDMSRVLTSPKT